MTRNELFASNPPVRGPQSLADLSQTENVWVAHVEISAVGHRSDDRVTAVCGARILQWPVAAGHLMRLCGRLCPDCWQSQ